MQRFISIDSGDKLHSLLLEHHINKQRDGVEIAELHPPITSPPQTKTIFQMKDPITSPTFVPPPTFPATSKQGAISRTLSNLFTRKVAKIE